MRRDRTEENAESRTKEKCEHGLLRRCLLIAVGLILGINVYLWNARSLGGNQLPMPFGYGMAVVLSGSMEPALKVDDLILVRETDQYEVGDIVVYQSGYELIVHRIVFMDGNEIVTQGDANSAADSPIVREAVKGIVSARIPFVGKLAGLLKKPVGIMLVLVCAFLLVELSFRREKRMDDEKLDAIKEEIRRLKKDQERNQEENQENGQ